MTRLCLLVSMLVMMSVSAVLSLYSSKISSRRDVPIQQNVPIDQEDSDSSEDNEIGDDYASILFETWFVPSPPIVLAKLFEAGVLSYTEHHSEITAPPPRS